MEFETMKTNKKIFLTLALVAACCTQTAHGMDYVNRGVSTAKNYWKPVAGTVAVVGVCYWLWSHNTTKNEDITKLRENAKDLFLEHMYTYINAIYKTQNEQEKKRQKDNLNTLFYDQTPETRSLILNNNNQFLYQNTRMGGSTTTIKNLICSWHEKEKVIIINPHRNK
jgi:hypothetical protein